MNMVTAVDSGSGDGGRRRANGSTARTGAHDDIFKLRAGLGQRAVKIAARAHSCG